MIEAAFLIALASTTILFALKKHRVLPYRACEFCVGFWISALLTIAFCYFFVGFERQAIVIPFAAAPVCSMVNKYLYS